MAVLTELVVINYMLVNAGEQPVASLTGDNLSTDTTTAKFLLDLITKESQERGLDENVYETLIPLNLVFNTIPLPSNTIDVYLRMELRHVDSSGKDCGQINVAIRDNHLYNASAQTNDFSNFAEEIEAEGGCRVALKVYLDFEDLNPTTKRMIMEEAARRYQLATQGDQAVDGFLSQRSTFSRVNSRANDFNNKGRNLFDGSDARRFFAVSRKFPYHYRSSSDDVRRGY